VKDNQILAVIPAYNEASRITGVVSGALDYLPVLVVDDGSQDGTEAVAEETGAKVLKQMPNQGKGAALRTGMRWAIQQGFGAVVTLDADGQHDPSEIPRFLAVFESDQPDLIIGARDFRQMPWTRRLANGIGRWSFSWALGQTVLDNQSGYRLLSERMIAAVLDSQEQGFEFEVEMIVTCVRHGFHLAWVPIRTIYGGENSHINPWQHALNWMRIVGQTRRQVRGAAPVLHSKT
jgi:glycosyltransferase involved in cell wall biosynthesis